MSKYIGKDILGRKVYHGMQTSKQTEISDSLLNFLEIEIPKIEKELAAKYGSSVLYKYYLGKKLDEYLIQYNVLEKERRTFWDEIKNFASSSTTITRDDGKNSKVRSFFEQCYILSQIDIETVNKLSWRQWQNLLDRVVNREDKRIFDWIKEHTPKIKEDEWRSFQKALNLYLKNMDTSVFSQNELFSIYESILFMSQYWLKAFSEYAKRHPKSLKIKSKGKWELKFYTQCFLTKKEQKKDLDSDLCSEVFLNIGFKD
ncbi:MAG: ATP-dependent helicase [Clostridia bacterium]|nr:ATP-dependent helicase [Clostridia bacterium]